MITDIPDEAEFHEVGLSLLNLSWDGAASLLTRIYGEFTPDYDDEMHDEYWAAARHPLALSLATAQQGAEFLLKARIVAVSPFLLFTSFPEKLPKDCHKKNTSFSDFLTINATDLMRVHDTCAPTRLPPEFVNSFNELRRQRNAIMHTVDRRLDIQVEKLISAILMIHFYLCPGKRWIDARVQGIQNSPIAKLYPDSNETAAMLSSEFSLVCELLTPKEMKKFFGFSKSRRLYLCPYCRHVFPDMDLMPLTSHLEPNNSTSTNLWCFVCDNNQKVTREKCDDPKCSGNVIDDEYEECATCGK